MDLEYTIVLNKFAGVIIKAHQRVYYYNHCEEPTNNCV